jgi:adenylyltransferase/sulfurtransferase
MIEEDMVKKRIRVILPSVTSFYIEYKNEDGLKDKICKKLEIEPEFTNLTFINRDYDPLPINSHEVGKDLDEAKDVIVDYVWARQMISLGEKQKKLRDANALVVGAGALGNEVVKNLASLGFGIIKIVDYDIVEYSNVSKGIFELEDIGKMKAVVLAERMQKSNPYTRIVPIPLKVEECPDKDLRSQVIISALDNMLTRIWLSSFCIKYKIPLVDGGIRAFSGRVQTYLPNGPCLACNIPLDKYAEIMELKNPCENLDYDAVASFSSVASIVAGIQANEAMKIVVGLPSLKGTLLMDVLNNSYSVLPLKRNKSCFVCGDKAVSSVIPYK